MKRLMLTLVALMFSLSLIMVSIPLPVSAATYGWIKMTNPSTDTLNDVWGSSPSNVYAVGVEGIFHYDGTSWSHVYDSGETNLSAIWGSSSSDVFVVGEAGTILHYDGASWGVMTSGTTQWLAGVWGDAPNNVYAVGTTGTIRHYDGTSWNTFTSGTIKHFSDISDSAGGLVLTCNESFDGYVRQTNNVGVTTTKEWYMGNRLYAIWNDYSGNEYFVGARCDYGKTVILRRFLVWNETLQQLVWSWERMSAPSEANLYDIWGSSPANIYAVGWYGVILQYDGSNWQSVSSPTAASLNGIWGSSVNDVFAVGIPKDGMGTILHYTEILEPSTVTLSAAPLNIEANGSSSDLTVLVEDQYGNPVADGTDVVFKTNHGTLSTGTTQTSGGIATATLYSDISAEPIIATVTATAGTASDVTAVFFIPPGGTEVTDAQTDTIIDSGTIKDTLTGGDVSISASGEHNITIAQYANNPGGTVTFQATGNYYDVHLDNESDVASLEIEFSPTTASIVIYYWNGTEWLAASDQYFEAPESTIVIVTASTSPSLSDLSGLIFATSNVEADLSITKTVSQDPVYDGDGFTYTIVITNTGPGSATGIEVEDTIPSVFQYVTAYPSTTWEIGNTLHWDPYLLYAGESLTITIWVDVPLGSSTGSVTNTVTVTSDSDPNAGNNTASVAVSVNPSNSPPVIAGLPNVSLDEDTALNGALDLWAYASDVEDADSSLTFSIVGNTNPNCGATIDSNRFVDINPAPGWNGSSEVAIQVMDTGGLTGTDAFSITVNPVNTPPVANADQPSVTVDEGVIATNTGTYNDPDGDTVILSASVGVVTNNNDGTWSWGFPTSDGPAESQTVTITADDGNGASDEATFELIVNNVAPTATFNTPTAIDEGDNINLSLTGSSDPSSADTAIGVEYTFDCGDGSGYGDYSASNSIICPTDDNGIRTVKGKIRDKDGGETEYIASVTINNVAPMIDTITAPIDPVDIKDQPVSVSVMFSDPGTADTHDVTWEWGDSNGDTQIGTTSPASQDHVYTEPGVYSVTVTVEDDDGDCDSAVYEFIVIYNPEGGFVTGGGWIYSATGADKLNLDAEGKANFGFVSKYKKGASVPTGNTEFQFKAGDLNFHSSSYDWLVVTGSDYAMFKGTGTINSDGEYKFMLWAGDSESDTFRIRIWTEDNEGMETVRYDNGFDQEIGGGSIVIHTKKK